MPVAAIKHPNQEQVGEERVYFSLQFSGYTSFLRELSVQELKTGTCRQDPKPRPWRNAAGWLALHGLLSLLLMSARMTCPALALPRVHTVPSHRIIDQEKFPCGLACRSALGGHFSMKIPSFPPCRGLRQVDEMQ